MRKVVFTPDAPQPVGPYSQGIVANGQVFVAGQGPMDVTTGQMVRDSIQAETRQVLTNIRTILQAAGTDLQHVVKCNVYLANRYDFKAMNEVYAQFFPTDPPARTTVEAHAPTDIRVEIDCVAVLPD